MDKPLKYFLVVSALFACFIGVFILGLLTQKKEALPNEYAFVDENDKSIADAKKNAASTLDTFFALYPRHIDSSFIRFSFEPTKGHVEHLWGKVIALDSVHVKVQLNRKEGLEDVYYPGERELHIDRVEDWMVYTGKSNIRGGYTVQAMLMKEAASSKGNTDSLHAQLQKFTDKLE